MNVREAPLWNRLLTGYLAVLCGLFVLACALYWTARLRWPWYVAGIASVPLALLKLVRALAFLGDLLRIVVASLWRYATGRATKGAPPARNTVPITKTERRKQRRAARGLR